MGYEWECFFLFPFSLLGSFLFIYLFLFLQILLMWEFPENYSRSCSDWPPSALSFLKDIFLSGLKGHTEISRDHKRTVWLFFSQTESTRLRRKPRCPVLSPCPKVTPTWLKPPALNCLLVPFTLVEAYSAFSWVWGGEIYPALVAVVPSPGWRGCLLWECNNLFIQLLLDIWVIFQFWQLLVRRSLNSNMRSFCADLRGRCWVRKVSRFCQTLWERLY